MRTCGLVVAVCVTLCSCAEAPDSGESTQAVCSQEDMDRGCCPSSPIIVDMAGDGVRLTSAGDGVVFRLKPKGFGLWAWTERGSDDAFLALDLDQNGRIDDGSELFGDGSKQLASPNPTGFKALAYYDMGAQGGNYDGVLDERDAVWSRLVLWRDADHDAFNADGELTPIAQSGVRQLSLHAKASDYKDEHGNQFRYTSTIVADAPISTTVVDVWLTQAPLPRESDDSGLRDYTEYTCWAWAYAVQANGPDGPGGQNEGPCDVATVQGDPLATTAGGYLARLVARFSVSRVKVTAMNRSREIVFNATRNSSGFGPCHTHGFPTPDLYYPPPYDDDGSEWSFETRVKCFSRIVTEGGGGGGDGCAAPDPE